MEVKPEVVEQIFVEQVMPGLEQGGFPIDRALAEAHAQQAQGTEGISFAVDRTEKPSSERIIMQIGRDEITFSYGSVGPFDITVSAVERILEDRKTNRS